MSRDLFDEKHINIALAITTLVSCWCNAANDSSSCASSLENYGVPSPEMDANDLQFFFLGSGGTGSVYRVVPNGDVSRQFARKIYSDPAAKESETNSLRVLRSILKDEKVRVVKVLGNNEPLVQDFEFVAGVDGASQPYREHFGRGISKSETEQLMDEVEHELSRRFPGQVSNWIGIIEIAGTDISINIKADGIVREAKTGYWVIVDPW